MWGDGQQVLFLLAVDGANVAGRRCIPGRQARRRADPAAGAAGHGAHRGTETVRNLGYEGSRQSMTGAITYRRKSFNDPDRRTSSVGDQHLAAAAYAERHGFELAGFLGDDSITGAG